MVEKYSHQNGEHIKAAMDKLENRYSGDVGDFGKFGLIKHLTDGSLLTLGINWYLFPNEDHYEDGKYTEYLSKHIYEQCDPELFHRLKNVINSTRSVKTLENSDLFNCNTCYFSNTIDFYTAFPDSTKAHKTHRLSLCMDWRQKSINALTGTDILFLDPENGLEINSCKSLSQKKSGKFSYYDEIREFHHGKKYCHLASFKQT